ncbi:hypothetical protein ASC97_03480 [Rhizobium sp. Root1203]|uniref:hypothetical protein n=1 Tax=Rhizobium sp. Root1203 TaxID=1736427 RepID=UPI000708EB76|nr:hypothetical protein [Rhizobium sp. Root1203]KQV32640.1 hypothetical protein ASC97_03480 [Rhizobium sp. Root1203]
MPLSAENLVADPRFMLGIRFHAGRMRSMFDAGPRLARLLASQQRWLLTQMAYALSMERDPADSSSGLTAVRLTSEITALKVASRNTVLSFVDELFTYRFIVCEPGDERKRPRHYEPSDISHQAMFGWLWSNLCALDILDGSDRAAQLQAQPGWMRLMQPRIARNCVGDPLWREPPEQIGLFLWNDAGGLIVDHLMSRIDLEETNPDRFLIGHIDSRALAADFMMSRTHMQRLFAKAAQQGCVGWDTGSKRPLLWISRAFVREYCHWQAIKFAYVDEAFHWVRALSEERTGKQQCS